MSKDVMQQPFEIEIDVIESDIDLLGHVNNVVYLRWVQDAAVAHWTAGATKEEQENIFWVVTRHEIDYKRSAIQSDTIIAKTWIGSAEKWSFERFTELRRKSDQKILAKARTLWCPINSQNRRPITLTDKHYKRFSTNFNISIKR